MYVFVLSPERTNCADTRFGRRSAHWLKNAETF